MLMLMNFTIEKIPPLQTNKAIKTKRAFALFVGLQASRHRPIASN